MPTRRWIGRLAFSAVLVAAAGTGCKTFTERYISLEVWKYERCFGHLPPGFVPPGAQQPAAAAPRACGQSAPYQSGCRNESMGCNDCGTSGMMSGGMMHGGGMMMDGAMPSGASVPTPAGVSAGKPVVISDELVVP